MMKVREKLPERESTRLARAERGITEGTSKGIRKIGVKKLDFDLGRRRVVKNETFFSLSFYQILCRRLRLPRQHARTTRHDAVSLSFLVNHVFNGVNMSIAFSSVKFNYLLLFLFF